MIYSGQFPLYVLSMDAMTDDEDQLRRCVGTTADLIAIRLPGADDSSSAINAIFMGRQRIRITDVWSERR